MQSVEPEPEPEPELPRTATVGLIERASATAGGLGRCSSRERRSQSQELYPTVWGSTEEDGDDETANNAWQRGPRGSGSWGHTGTDELITRSGATADYRCVNRARSKSEAALGGGPPAQVMSTHASGSLLRVAELTTFQAQNAEPAHPKWHACPRWAAAAAFVRSMGLDAAYLEPKHDRCYCEVCYPAACVDTITNEGPTPYVVPRGWCGFGFRMQPRAHAEDIFNKWSASFHGVDSPAVLKSILQCGQLMKPGDKLLDGSVLCSAKSMGRQDPVFYTSPTVKYAGLKLYARPQPHPDEKGLQASMVLQCRQKPGSFELQGETMGFGTHSSKVHFGGQVGPWPGHLERECPHVDLDTIEWKSDNNVAAIPYRLLVRVFRTTRDEHNYCSPGDTDSAEAFILQPDSPLPGPASEGLPTDTTPRRETEILRGGGSCIISEGVPPGAVEPNSDQRQQLHGAPSDVSRSPSPGARVCRRYDAVFTGAMECQFGGKGAFEAVEVVLSKATAPSQFWVLEIFRGHTRAVASDRISAMQLPLAGVWMQPPRTAREGRPHCVRISGDNWVDDRGLHKYIFSLSSVEELQQWHSHFAAAGARTVSRQAAPLPTLSLRELLDDAARVAGRSPGSTRGRDAASVLAAGDECDFSALIAGDVGEDVRVSSRKTVRKDLTVVRGERARWKLSIDHHHVLVSVQFRPVDETGAFGEQEELQPVIELRGGDRGGVIGTYGGTHMAARNGLLQVTINNTSVKGKQLRCQLCLCPPVSSDSDEEAMMRRSAFLEQLWFARNSSSSSSTAMSLEPSPPTTPSSNMLILKVHSDDAQLLPASQLVELPSSKAVRGELTAALVHALQLPTCPAIDILIRDAAFDEWYLYTGNEDLVELLGEVTDVKIAARVHRV
jgi:hypothetical protein